MLFRDIYAGKSQPHKIAFRDRAREKVTSFGCNTVTIGNAPFSQCNFTRAIQRLYEGVAFLSKQV